MRMKYRDEDLERRYRHLRATRGSAAVDWKGASFDAFDLRKFLEQALAQIDFAGRPLRALEYGTGTGPGACFLAARGFDVDAIDVSRTAIELAEQVAAGRGLKVRFAVADICEFSGTGQPYDLVVDNFCLHCLVADDERQAALRSVRQLIKHDGRFLVGTAVFYDGRVLPDGTFDPESGILYRRVGGAPDRYADAVRRNGEWYCPYRRYVRAAVLRTEIERAGFDVLWQEGGRVICAPANG